MVRYYLDTSIYRDYFENRSDRFRPLGEWALALLKKIVAEEHELIISHLVIDELRKDYSTEKVKDLFKWLESFLVWVEATPNQMHESARICKQCKVPFGDALHAVLARDNEAIMVTRDHHFEELQEVVMSCKPEDLI